MVRGYAAKKLCEGYVEQLTGIVYRVRVHLSLGVTDRYSVALEWVAKAV